MNRPDSCPNCGASATAHTGTYCHECGEPLFEKLEDKRLALMPYQANEHAAWLAVVGELRAVGAGDINAGGENESLHNAICTWGEMLAQLRMNDPNPEHAEEALKERTDAYPVTNEVYKGA